MDCHGNVLLQLMGHLYRALKRGRFKALLRFQIDCRHNVEKAQEEKQLEVSKLIREVRPWLQLHVTWPMEGEEDDMSDSESDSDSSVDVEEVEDGYFDFEDEWGDETGDEDDDDGYYDSELEGWVSDGSYDEVDLEEGEDDEGEDH